MVVVSTSHTVTLTHNLIMTCRCVFPLDVITMATRLVHVGSVDGTDESELG